MVRKILRAAGRFLVLEYPLIMVVYRIVFTAIPSSYIVWKTSLAMSILPARTHASRRHP